MRIRFALVACASFIALTFVGLTATAAASASSLSINPASVSLTADETQTFAVTAKMTDGTTTDVTAAATLSTDDPLGSLAGATYHAGKAGAWTIQASYQGLTASAAVTITPGVLDEIDINPSSGPEVVSLGKTRTFTAKAFDQHNNVITGLPITWTVIGEIGTVSSKGVLSAQKIGTGKVQATSGNVTGQVSVVVKAAAAEPTNANTNTSANANGNANTNADLTNDNTNAAGTTNVNAPTNTSASTQSNPSPCSTLKPWVWTIILIVFLAAVAILYAFYPVTRIWPAALAFVAAIILTIIQRKYGCDLNAWWAWVITLGTVALTLVGLRQNPPPTLNKP